MENKIKNVLDNFNFKKVKNNLLKLGKQKRLEELISDATFCLEKVSKTKSEYNYVICNGFIAIKTKNNLGLCFIIEGYTTRSKKANEIFTSINI
jgi:hypothetical protein